jgi:hypothetical protein
MPEETVHRNRFSDHCCDLAKSPMMVPEMTAAMAGVIGKTTHVINGFGAPPTWQFCAAASPIR